MLVVSMYVCVRIYDLDLTQPMHLLNRPLMIQEATQQHMHDHVLLIHSSRCVQITLSHGLAGVACGYHKSFCVSTILHALACLCQPHCHMLARMHWSVASVDRNFRQATGCGEVKLKGGVEITPFGFGWLC